VFTVSVTTTGAGYVVVVNQPGALPQAAAETEDKGPSPIAPELKEMAWGAGSFVVFFVLLRLVLFPRVKKGMDARYGKISSDHQTAESLRAAAKAEVAEYEAQLAAIRTEAARRVDAARQTLEAERTSALAEANSRIAAKRAEAAAATEAARAAVAPHIREAVVDVSGRAAELATGRRPDAARVNEVVGALIAGGAQ